MMWSIFTVFYTTPCRSPRGNGTDDAEPSFFREYHFKLEWLYDRFLTARGAELARERRKIAAVYYEALWREVTEGRAVGRKLLEESITAE